AEEVLLRFLDTLGDRRGHFLGLAVADADLAVPVTDDDESGEAEATTTLDDLGDAVDRYDALEVRGLVLGRPATATVTTVPAVPAPALAGARPALSAGLPRTSRHQAFLPFSRFLPMSELQPALTGSVGQGGNPPVVGVSAAVEHHLGDARLLGTGRDQLADLGGLGLLVALDGLNVRLEAGGRCQGVSRHIVDQLDEDVARGTLHRHPRTLRRTTDLLAQPVVSTDPASATTGGDVLADQLALGNRFAHDHLPVFPTLRRIRSPS